VHHSVTHFSHSVLFENRHAVRWRIDINVPPPDTLAVTLVFAIAAALLAGLYPAFRAGQ